MDWQQVSSLAVVAVTRPSSVPAVSAAVAFGAAFLAAGFFSAGASVSTFASTFLAGLPPTAMSVTFSSVNCWR